MKQSMKMLTILLAMNCGALAIEYKVDPAASQISFSGTNSGEPFQGKFEKWDASIQFDPESLNTSKVSVSIDTSTAKTGNAQYDGTLPSDDWFAVKSFPKAQFVSKTIVKNAEGSYTMEGTLQIRDKVVPVKFQFLLTPADLSKAPITTSFSLSLDRLAFDMGKKSDPKADFVGKEIKLDVTLKANPVK